MTVTFRHPLKAFKRIEIAYDVAYTVLATDYKSPSLVMIERKEMIRCRWMQNGDIRFYLDNERKGGVSELVTNHMNNIAQTITCSNVNNVIIEY